MSYRYEFLEAAARDLLKLTRHNQKLLVEIATKHIPAVLRDPYAAGEAKEGNLARLRAYEFNFKGVAYRLIYTIEDDVILIIAIGPHDVAYARARRR
jgi:mRNA-degrading endonuclease RelE of RelBE toxin-antitoxin system